MSPDAHQDLVVGKESRPSGGPVTGHASLQVAIVEPDLDRGEAHQQHVLVLRHQELGERRVVSALRGHRSAGQRAALGSELATQNDNQQVCK